MRSRRRGAEAQGRIFLATCLVLLGCNAPMRPRADAPEVDSAGITIIASAAPVWAEGRGWFVADSPIVDITAIGSPDAALRLSDGRIVVADGRADELRYFGTDGRMLYAVGGAGDGPAALRSIYHLDLGKADTVAVYDLVRRRVMLFDPNGALARTIPIAEGLTPPGSNGFLPRGLAPDGRYLLQRDEVDFPFTGAPGSLLTDSTRLFWVSREGALTDSSARLMATELFGFDLRAGPDRKVTTPLARPFAPSLRVAPGPELVWAGDGAAWEVWGWGADGKVSRILRLPLERPLLTSVFRDTFIARYREQVAGAGPSTLPAQFAAGIESTPFPTHLPAFAQLMAGEDSTLWVQHAGLSEGVPGDASQLWTVFDPAGRWSGDVTMPSRFHPTAVGRGWILGLQPDAVGALRVRLYPLVER